MGDNVAFENKFLTNHFPLDTNKVTVLNTQTKESLIIEPLITFKKCIECGINEVLIFDKIVNKEIGYLSVDCGHTKNFLTLIYCQAHCIKYYYNYNLLRISLISQYIIQPHKTLDFSREHY